MEAGLSPASCKIIRKDSVSFVASARILSATIAYVGRKELICWKIQSGENFARIIRRASALFFRDAVCIRWHEHLYITLNLNNGKHTQGYINAS